MKLNAIIAAIRKFIKEKFNSKNEDLPYYITIVLALIFFIGGLNAFVELTDELMENELESIDKSVAHEIQSFRSDNLTTLFSFITDLGDRYTYVILILSLAAYFFIKYKNWKFIAQCTVVLLLSSLSNVVLKKYINRARPDMDHLVEVNTLSYPSGHSMSAMAFYGFLIYLAIRYTKSPLLKTIFIALLSLLILLIGISRIYLGVHYPTDVAAGFIGGFIWITLCILIFNIIGLWLKRRSRGGKESSAP